MKKVLFVLFLISSSLVISLPVASQDIILTPKLGSSVLYGLRSFAGVELQASSVSVTAKWCPIVINNVYSNGFSISATIYLYEYSSSPFFSTSILYEGKKNIDKLTNKSARSMPIFAGYRFYPAEYFNHISKNLSFDLGTGVELCSNTSVRPYLEFSANFNIFKY